MGFRQEVGGLCERRKDHRVSTRDLQIHKVGGVRHADKMRAVLMDYKKHYPGCVITEKNAVARRRCGFTGRIRGRHADHDGP